jgi:hypothetical protein
VIRYSWRPEYATHGLPWRRGDAEVDIQMKNEAKDQLKKILGVYDEKLAETERLDAANRAAHAAFPVRFATLRAETIRPVIAEFVEVLAGRGHEALAREQEESMSSGGGSVTLAAISLRVIPKPFAHTSKEANRGYVEVTFTANRVERKVTVSSTNTLINSGGSVGKRGEYEIDAVTADVVADHVLRTLQEALAGTR